METEEKKCPCPCHHVMGIFIVLFGLMFLLGALGVLSERTVGIIWPVLVILAGLKKVFSGFCKCCDRS